MKDAELHDLVHAGPVCVRGLDILLVAERALIWFPVPF